MPQNGIKRLLRAATRFNSNRKHLNDPDPSSRYYAERTRDDLLDAATEAHLAAKQHEMLRGGLCSIYNRLRDEDAWGRNHHFRTLSDVERELRTLLNRYEESCIAYDDESS